MFHLGKYLQNKGFLTPIPNPHTTPLPEISCAPFVTLFWVPARYNLSTNSYLGLFQRADGNFGSAEAVSALCFSHFLCFPMKLSSVLLRI
jgi:hypothetical protein